jgi:hypothetical protein
VDVFVVTDPIFVARLLLLPGDKKQIKKSCSDEGHYTSFESRQVIFLSLLNIYVHFFILNFPVNGKFTRKMSSSSQDIQVDNTKRFQTVIAPFVTKRLVGLFCNIWRREMKREWKGNAQDVNQFKYV